MSIEIFQDNMEASKLIEMMRSRLPELEELYLEGYLRQQDGSEVHRALSITNFINQNMPGNVE